MKDLKIIEGWNEHKPLTEKVCELNYCGHRDSFSALHIEALLYKQAQLSYQQGIDDTLLQISKIPKIEFTFLDAQLALSKNKND